MRRRFLRALSVTLFIALGGAGVAFAVADPSVTTNPPVVPAGPITAEAISAQQAQAILDNASASAASARQNHVHNLRSLLLRVDKLRVRSNHHRAPLAHIASATGCNQEVCININGSGLHINYWQDVVFMNNGGCTSGLYYAYGRYVFSTPRLCRSGSWVYVGQVDNLNFPSNGEACNAATGAPGFPCEYVHS
jgi:hypothetical protein